MWELASRVGVSVRQPALPKDLARLPLGLLVRLAEIVDLPLARLFGDPRDDERAPPDDASVLGACLGAHAQRLTRDALARSLGWHLDRVEAALGHLDAALSKIGLRLGAEGKRIRIASATGSLGPVTRAALDRNVADDGQVGAETAKAVWTYLFVGDADVRLRTSGVVEAFRRRLVGFDGARTRVSDSVVFSLILDDSEGCPPPSR